MDVGSKKQPKYQDIDGFRMPRFVSPDAFRSCLRYKPRPDDIFIATYPKCGTTWTQMIVRLILHKGEPFQDACDFFVSSPFLELSGADGPDMMTRPGGIKVHLPFHMTPYSPEAKYIFVARNPKDACVSFYHHCCLLPMYDFVGGEFDVFFENFVSGKTDFGDYFDTHLSWYERRHDPNMLFFTYEDLKKNPKKGIMNLAGFLGKEYSDLLEKDSSLLETVQQKSSLSFMKDRYKHFDNFIECFSLAMKQGRPLPSGYREMVENAEKSGEIFEKREGQSFFRKGKVGDWKGLFTEDQLRRLRDRAAAKTKGTDFMTLWED